MVNVGTAITKAMTKLTGSLPRPQFVTWFNEIVKDIYAQPREWAFLDDPLSIAIVNNTVTIPTTITEIFSIQVGAVIYTPVNLLSAVEAAKADSNDSELQGYTLSAANVLTFHPAISSLDSSTSATVTGELAVNSDYADNAATIFPNIPFENLFIAGLRMHYYDQSKDGRFTKENMQYQIEMSRCKSWDNRKKPLMHYDRRGYIRG